MRTLRSKLREWWPEVVFAALMLLFLLVGAQDGPLFVVFVVIIVTIGWAMGYRHRTLSLHGKVDRMTDGVGEMLAEMRTGRTDGEETPRPVFRVLPGGRG